VVNQNNDNVSLFSVVEGGGSNGEGGSSENQSSIKIQFRGSSNKLQQ
jgi:hypothetical protein